MYVTRLDFDASEVLMKMLQIGNDAKIATFCEWERRKYVDWVNKVLHLHKTLALDDFRVAFDLNKFCGSEIDKWLQYAFGRRVQKLELVSECGEIPVALTKSYTFPYELLGLSAIHGFVFKWWNLILVPSSGIGEKDEMIIFKPPQNTRKVLIAPELLP